MLIATTLRSTFIIKLPPKIVKYRSYKNFNATVPLLEFDQKHVQGNLHRSDNPDLNLIEIFSSILDKYSPIKSKKLE